MARCNSECEDCAAGKFALVTATAASCEVCPPGTWSSAGQFASCEACDNGKIPNGQRTACENCTAGKFAQVTATEASCEVCPPGTWSPAGQSGSCQSCSDGQVPTDKRDACEDCAAGKFALVTATAASCEVCPPGTWSPPGRFASCLLCASGSEPNAFSSGCEVCQPGTFAAAGTVRCEPCLPGQFANTSSAAACQDCPVGHFAASGGAAGCTPCPMGRFADGKGLESCKACDARKFSNTGAATCQDCPTIGADCVQGVLLVQVHVALLLVGLSQYRCLTPVAGTDIDDRKDSGSQLVQLHKV